MKKRNLILGGVLGAGLLGLLAAGAVSAHAYGRCGFGHGGFHHHQAFGGHGLAGPGGGMRHMLGRLDLSDQQRDQVFQIMYQQMPAQHAKMTALRKDREDLRAATSNGSFDEQKVRALADEQAKILSDLTVMRAQTMSQVYALLTPEQQQELSSWKEHRHWRRD